MVESDEHSGKKHNFWVNRLEDAHKTSFDFGAKAKLEKILGDRILNSRLNGLGDQQFPHIFVEIGAGVSPITRAALDGMQYVQSKPTIVLSDTAYTKPKTRAKALKELVDGWLNEEQTHAMYATKRHLLSVTSTHPEEDYENAVEKISSSYAETHFFSTDIAEFTVPDTFGLYNLCFASIANYVDRQDLEKLVADPRVASVAFVNSATAGIRRLGSYFHENRFTSTLDIMRMIQAYQFTLIDFIITSPTKNKQLLSKDSIPLNDFTSPPIGAIFVKSAFSSRYQLHTCDQEG